MFCWYIFIFLTPCILTLSFDEVKTVQFLEQKRRSRWKFSDYNKWKERFILSINSKDLQFSECFYLIFMSETSFPFLDAAYVIIMVLCTLLLKLV